MARPQLTELCDKQANTRFHDDVTNVAHGVGWAVSGAIVGALAWWVGGIAALIILEKDVHTKESTAEWCFIALILSGLGIVSGAVILSVSHMFQSRIRFKRFGERWCWGAGIGAAAGCLPPLSAAALDGFLPIETSLVLAGCMVGMFTGIFAFAFGRNNGRHTGTYDEGSEGFTTLLVRHHSNWYFGAIFRIAPVVLVTAGCLLISLLGTPSPVGWAILVVGLLGLGNVWALMGQERRIRMLEHRLNE